MFFVFLFEKLVLYDIISCKSNDNGVQNEKRYHIKTS